MIQDILLGIAAGTIAAVTVTAVYVWYLNREAKKQAAKFRDLMKKMEQAEKEMIDAAFEDVERQLRELGK